MLSAASGAACCSPDRCRMDVALLVLLMPQAAALSFVPPVRAPHTALRLRGGTMALLAAARREALSALLPLASLREVCLRVGPRTSTAMLRSVDPAEVAVLVATYLDREGYAATAKQFQQDASVLLARVAPPAGRVKDLQTVVSGYIRAHSLLAVPVGIARFVRHDRPGAFVLGGAALLFVLRVRQLRRRAARLAEAKAQAEVNGELQEEPSWLEEAAARLRDTQE